MVPSFHSHRLRTPRADVRLVLDAAASLDIREFDLFAGAHKWWFGHHAEIKALERVFAAYMFHGIVPPWVRQYARRVLNPSRCRPPNSPRRVAFGLRPVAPAPRHARLIVALSVALFGLIYLGLVGAAAEGPAAADAEPGPPGHGAAAVSCRGGGPGLAFFESLAHALAGQQPPACD